jgi:hypothetical protein
MRETVAEKVTSPDPLANDSNKTCPSCRRVVHKVTDDFRANSLLEVYLKMNPSKARSPDEVKDLDKEYKRGEPVPPF